MPVSRATGPYAEGVTDRISKLLKKQHPHKIYHSENADSVSKAVKDVFRGTDVHPDAINRRFSVDVVERNVRNIRHGQQPEI